jgi:CHASE2 domain-containing sensor protein
MPDLDGQVVGSGAADSMVARREEAIKRIKAKNDFKIHLLVYLAINGMLVFTWAFTGAGFFWPIFPIVAWGIGVVAHGYQVYGNVYTEERIQREMEKLP